MIKLMNNLKRMMMAMDSNLSLSMINNLIVLKNHTSKNNVSLARAQMNFRMKKIEITNY